MDNIQTRRRMVQLCMLFVRLVSRLRAPDSLINFHRRVIVKKLKLLMYIFAMLILPPPPPAPKYEQVLFQEALPQRQLHHARDQWEEIMNDGRRCFTLTGETPHSIAKIVEDLYLLLLSRRRHPRRFRRFRLTARNRILMIFIWLRHYPREELLATQFGISTSVVSKDIHCILPVLWHYFQTQIQWPDHQQWLEMTGYWEDFPNAVGVIDGCLTEINRPLSEPQHDFFSGHGRYHCVSTQVIIDNRKHIRFLRSGFLGHCNDATQFQLLPTIGDGQELHLPAHLYFLADSIYPNRHPLLTPYRRNQIQGENREDLLLFNLAHRRRRVTVEHVISVFKTYAVLKGTYRHERWFLPLLADVCAALSHRRIVINQELR